MGDFFGGGGKTQVCERKGAPTKQQQQKTPSERPNPTGSSGRANNTQEANGCERWREGRDLSQQPQARRKKESITNLPYQKYCHAGSLHRIHLQENLHLRKYTSRVVSSPYPIRVGGCTSAFGRGKHAQRLDLRLEACIVLVDVTYISLAVVYTKVRPDFSPRMVRAQFEKAGGPAMCSPQKRQKCINHSTKCTQLHHTAMGILYSVHTYLLLPARHPPLPWKRSPLALERS